MAVARLTPFLPGIAHSQFIRFMVPSGFFVGTATKPCVEHKTRNTPGAVVNTHPRVPEQVSRQNNVTRRDAGPTGSPQRFLQVHARLSEQLGQAFGFQLLAGGIQERRERHVDRTGEMSRQRVCEGEEEE
ncbi:hypothetical protein EYF80_048867 [Liparis tanakae]|uniref:Uncharacterized protein n=1 Tax=Liparis tanakae TaxID=230148 RepID=A0A4Z2FIA6_9TELE|nr:hypothetical protein EYF80_048867 [Liparis tanakae]